MALLARCTPIGLALLLWGSLPAIASVKTREVAFRLQSPQAGGDAWLECSIEVDIRRDSSDPARRRPEYVDDLQVELLLGVESAENEARRFEFYRSEANPVSLKEGRHLIRFYLPPEVVERDRIRGAPRAYSVRLLRAGSVVEESVSRMLEPPNVRSSFFRKAKEESDRNAGILLPQHKTPFLSHYPRHSPSLRDLERGVASSDYPK